MLAEDRLGPCMTSLFVINNEDTKIIVSFCYLALVIHFNRFTGSRGRIKCFYTRNYSDVVEA